MAKKPNEEQKVVGAGIGKLIGGVVGALFGGLIGAGIAGWVGHKVESEMRKNNLYYVLVRHSTLIENC